MVSNFYTLPSENIIMKDSYQIYDNHNKLYDINGWHILQQGLLQNEATCIKGFWQKILINHRNCYSHLISFQKQPYKLKPILNPPDNLLLYFSPATTKKNRKSIVIERNSNKSKGIQMSI
jgi:hypothetical protein